MTIVHRHTPKVDVRKTLHKFYLDREDLARGSYAQVWSYKEGVVKLQTYGAAYVDYLRWVIKNQDNPYVPKIYRVDTWTGSVKDAVIVYMEKLDKLQKFQKSIDEYNAIRGYILHDDDTYLSTKPEDHHNHLIRLRKAVRELGVKHCYDLHSENVMLRQTKDGYLPVITDPVA